MLPINNSYDYSTIVSTGKKVRFRPWKTKDEKSFLTFLESTDNVTDEDFLRYLIVPCIEDKNLFLNSADIQHLLIEIRKISMGESFNMKFVCENETCGAVNDLDVEFDSIVTYKYDDVKEFIDEYNETKIKFGDIKNIAFYNEKTASVSAMDKTIIEIALRIEKITIKDVVHDSFKYEEVYEYLDNMDIKIFDKLLSYYNEHKSNINIVGDFYCYKCNSKNSFMFDEIPNFLVGW